MNGLRLGVGAGDDAERQAEQRSISRFQLPTRPAGGTISMRRISRRASISRM